MLLLLLLMVVVQVTKLSSITNAAGQDNYAGWFKQTSLDGTHTYRLGFKGIVLCLSLLLYFIDKCFLKLVRTENIINVGFGHY